MKVPYSYLEVEYILNDYDQQVPIKVIAENVNKDFHKGNIVRTVSSIGYVVRKSEEDDGWLNRLEDKWLEDGKD